MGSRSLVAILIVPERFGSGRSRWTGGLVGRDSDLKDEGTIDVLSVARGLRSVAPVSGRTHPVTAIPASEPSASGGSATFSRRRFVRALDAEILGSKTPKDDKCMSDYGWVKGTCAPT